MPCSGRCYRDCKALASRLRNPRPRLVKVDQLRPLMSDHHGPWGCLTYPTRVVLEPCPPRFGLGRRLTGEQAWVTQGIGTLAALRCEAAEASQTKVLLIKDPARFPGEHDHQTNLESPRVKMLQMTRAQ